jgi:hypothetical protein
MTAPARPMTFDRLKSQKKPATRSVRIALDNDVLDEFEEAKQERELAQMLMPADGDNAVRAKELTEANERYRRAREALQKNSVLFKFKAVGRKKYDTIVNNHPPTDANRAEMEKQGGDPNDISWNPETFPQELISVSCVEPELSYDQVKEMFESDDWSGPELMTLFNTALIVNTQNRVADLGKD